MSRTKELIVPQFFPGWEFGEKLGAQIGWIGYGNCIEINLCPDCNGSGAKMTNDRSEVINLCLKCNHTGRIKNE